MRVLDGELNQRFATWVRSLSYDPTLTGRIQLPASIAQFTGLQPFIDSVYPPALLQQAHTNLHTFYGRAILTIRNDTVAAINDTILHSLNGPESVFHSTDTVQQDNLNTESTPPPELLQSFNPTCLPPARLCLKVGAPIILLRNLYPKEGLCNGTRMVLTRIGRRCLEARILSAKTFADQLRVIPRIMLSSTEGELPFVINRRQFPICLSFAMTVNKSQGQSFNFVGVDLRIPAFTHGQLYVALSRVTTVLKMVFRYCFPQIKQKQTILYIQKFCLIVVVVVLLLEEEDDDDDDDVNSYINIHHVINYVNLYAIIT